MSRYFSLGWIRIFHVSNLILRSALFRISVYLAIRIIGPVTAASHLSIISIIQMLIGSRINNIVKSMRTLTRRKNHPFNIAFNIDQY